MSPAMEGIDVKGPVPGVKNNIVVISPVRDTEIHREQIPYLL